MKIHSLVILHGFEIVHPSVKYLFSPQRWKKNKERRLILHLPIRFPCLPNYPYLFKDSVVCLNSLLLIFYVLFCNFLVQVFVVQNT